MNYDRYTAGSFNITGEAQHARRLELRRWREGDRTVPPPFTSEPPTTLEDMRRGRTLAEVWGLVPPKQPYAGSE